MPREAAQRGPQNLLRPQPHRRGVAVPGKEDEHRDETSVTLAAFEDADAASLLELGDPEKFLVRLRNVVDVLVQDDWWFDREELQRNLPVN